MATKELLSLAERSDIPVITTLLGLGSFPGGHPLSMGMLGMHGMYWSNLSVDQADLIVGVGMRFDDRGTGRNDGFAPGAKIIHADIDPAEISKNRRADVPIVGDCKEVLADLVEAETSAQRRQALRQLQGELGKLYESWRERLLKALAHIEAGIDFSDEDLPGGVEAAAAEEVYKLVGEIAAHLKDNRYGERLRSGLLIAIIGPPNAGKSSLLRVISGELGVDAGRVARPRRTADRRVGG